MTARPRGTHLICTLIWNLLFCARAVLFSRSFSSLALYSREGRRPWRWRHRGWIPSRDGYVRRTRDGVGSPGLFRPVCSMASYIHACITLQQLYLVGVFRVKHIWEWSDGGCVADQWASPVDLGLGLNSAHAVLESAWPWPWQFSSGPCLPALQQNHRGPLAYQLMGIEKVSEA